MKKLEILVEEPSCEDALRLLLPLILPRGTRYDIRSFQGKGDLLHKLPKRLDGYRRLPDFEDLRIVVLIDRDRENCVDLKRNLERISREKGITSRTYANGEVSYQIANRIAIEELEAWFFGDFDAVANAYPQLKRNSTRLKQRKEFTNPDMVEGGTWEALEKILQRAGYYKSGLQKLDAAKKIAKVMQPDRNTSPSFILFRDTLREIVSQ